MDCHDERAEANVLYPPAPLLHNGRPVGPHPVLGALDRETLPVGRDDDRAILHDRHRQSPGVGYRHPLDHVLLAAGNGAHGATPRVV